MLKRHIEMRDHVLQLDDVNLDDLLLMESYENTVDELTKSLKKLNNVSLKLQQNTCTIRQARANLEFVLGSYPNHKAGLIPHARIVDVGFFEFAVIKIQDFCNLDLIETEKQEVRLLLIEEVDRVKVDTVSDSIVDRTLKHLRSTINPKLSD